MAAERSASAAWQHAVADEPGERSTAHPRNQRPPSNLAGGSKHAGPHEGHSRAGYEQTAKRYLTQRDQFASIKYLDL
jgi:hypothetical protein